MDTRVVLALGNLAHSEVSRFARELAAIKVGEFVTVAHAERDEYFTTVHVLSNGLLPSEVVQKLLRCSLTSEGGELYRLGWGKVIEIVD